MSVAVLVAVLYAVTRWALGIPLGISEEFLREGQEIGLCWAGAVLTLGLTQRSPELLWPLWRVALAAAALACYYRRRGRCGRCGRP